MGIDVLRYRKMLADDNIELIFCGSLWPCGIDGMAEALQKRLEYDNIPLSSSQAVFSIFVEQVNNMMIYSADKETRGGGKVSTKGIFILGVQNGAYFIRFGNVVTNANAAILKERIDHLNALDKKGLRRYYKEQIRAAPENNGAGVGLIEVARRASSPIEYELEPYGDGLQYFTMYTTVKQGENK